MKHVIISLICILSGVGISSAQTTDTLSAEAVDSAAANTDALQPGQIISEQSATETAADNADRIIDEDGTIYLSSDDSESYQTRDRTSDNAIRFMGVLMVFGSPIGIIWIVLGYRNSRYREKLRVVEKSLDLKTPLPPEFFTGSIKPSWYNLYAGIIWLGIGLSTIIFFLVLEVPVWPVGFVPAFIGISKIIVYTVVNRQKSTIVPPIPDIQEKNAEQD